MQTGSPTRHIGISAANSLATSVYRCEYAARELLRSCVFDARMHLNLPDLAAMDEMIAHFDRFQLDVRSAELRDLEGKTTQLAEQSFRILMALLERPGEVVGREELCQRLWPNGTIVEFEHSISVAVNRLRQALGDAADSPKFIETLARRGYRLKTPVQWVQSQHSISSPQIAASNLIGKRIAHYRILEILGGGGMGLVYKGEDIKLGRRVALKFLPEELAGDERALRRFEIEARAASALNNPNICTIYAVEEHDGQPFIAMEFLEGRSLRDIIAEACSARVPLPLDRVLETGMQIVDGLEAAHARGILHRDIKPSNIIVTTRGGAKILDFGLAKLQGADYAEPLLAVRAETKSTQVENLALTRTGAAMGTAGYMSPEQIRGVKLDVRTDLFSFGLVLYEMATGQRAFKGDTGPELQEAILKQVPISAREVNPLIPARLEKIISKALEKDREVRYQGAAELRGDLEILKLGIAGRQSRIPRLAVAAIVLVLLAAVLGWINEWKHRKLTAGVPAIRSLAVLPLENLSGDPEQKYFAEGMTEELIARLTKLSTVRVISRASMMRYDDTRKSLPQIARELGIDGMVEGSVMRFGDRVRINIQLIYAPRDQHLWAATYERNLKDTQELQADATRDIAGEIKLELSRQQQTSISNARAVDPEAHELYLKGRYFWNKRDQPGFTKAIEYFQQAVAKDPNYAEAYAGLADSNIFMLGYADGPRSTALRAAKAAAEKALQLDETLAEAHTSLALIATHLGRDWEGSRKHFERAIELNPNYATAHHWYADIYLAPMGRVDEAVAELHKAQELDPLSSIISTDIGKELIYARRYDEAITQLKKTLEMDSNFGLAHYWLWLAYTESGRYSDAFAELETTRSDPQPLFHLWGRAYLEAKSGNKGEARRLLVQLVQERQQQLIDPATFAFIYAALGERDQGFAWLEKAYTSPHSDLSSLKIGPMWDPIRSDPRFGALVRRVGLQQ
jgi:serine/threonine protein kinase/TolB-like protein/Tfp pilus assembly protein PilF